jgi:hypothetical protein
MAKPKPTRARRLVELGLKAKARLGGPSLPCGCYGKLLAACTLMNLPVSLAPRRIEASKSG